MLVPLNTRFKGAEAAYVLRRSRARLLFVTGTFLGTSYVASLRRAARRVRQGRCRAAAPGAGRGPRRRTPPTDFRTWKDFLAGGDGVAAGGRYAPGPTSIGPSAPSDIIFTSGTTGRPKGAVITHAQTLRCYDVWSELAGLREGDRYLIVNPFFHTFGYKAGIIACLMRGATMVPQPVFNVDTVLANIAAERISVLPGPPTLHQSLLDHPARDAPRPVRAAPGGHGRGGGPAAAGRAAARRAAHRHGPDGVRPLRGERHRHDVPPRRRRRRSIASTSGPRDPRHRRSRVDGRPPGGPPGEVLVRGHHVMRGYFEDPDETGRRPITADGWLRTGDVGVLDDGGQPADHRPDQGHVHRRRLQRLPGRDRATPRPAPGHRGRGGRSASRTPRLGEVGKAYAVRRPGSTLTADDLIAWSRREMANYKVPREVEFVAELPRNASGKV